MIDQHVHSEYSVDSKSTIDKYLVKMREKQCKYLTLTDHFDFLKNLRNDDLQTYFKFFDKMFEEIGNRNNEKIKVGIEVGYNILAVTEINSLLNRYNFSCILLSVHDNDEKNLEYFRASSSGYETDEVIKMYVTQIEEAITSNIDFDVFTHFGYIFRYLDKEINILDYVDYYDNALKLLALNNKALEINTGCFRKKTKNILKFYQQLLIKFKRFGGKYISVGSDAHDIKDYCYGFDTAYAIARSAGFTAVTHIIDRQFHLVDISSLQIVDQHSHSLYSPDSTVTIDSYLERMELFGNSYLNITDHLDLLEYIEKHPYHDYIGSFDNLFNANFDNRVKIGIEVGYNSTTVNKAMEVLAKHDFSIVLLSIHESDINQVKYSQPHKSSLSESEIVDLYVSQMEEAIDSGLDFDVLCHLGFLFRYSDIDPLKYVSKFDKVLEKLAKCEKALEYNTGCFYYNTANISEFYQQIFSKFLSYGGKYVSIGSDSHTIEEYSRDFNSTVKFLNKVGFNNVVQIKDRKFSLLKIGESNEDR